MTNHRQRYHRAWSQLTPPLRPHPDVVAAVKEQIKDRHGRTLLLGVTPELADVAPDLVAVDRNLSMVANVWPGNTSSRCAVVGDSRNSNFAPAVFSLCIGDGSLCGLKYPTEIAALFDELNRILERKRPDSLPALSFARRRRDDLWAKRKRLVWRHWQFSRI